MNKNLLVKIAICLSLIVVVLFVIWLAFGKFSENLKEVLLKRNKLPASLIGEEALVAKIPDFSQIPQTLRPVRDWSIEELRIDAKAAIIVETDLINNNKILFRKNEQEQLPIASLTKLMTALVISEDLENYGLNLVTIISDEAVAQPGKQGLLTSGEYLSVENLLYIMLIESSNDAAYALAEIIGVNRFVNEMNRKAMELGLFSSNFVDVAGLSSDNYSTAEDLVRLTKYLLQNHPLVWEILLKDNYMLFTPEGKKHHELINTNELLGKIPDIIGGKTGLTLWAKGCLLFVLQNQNNQNDLIYVILGSEDRFGEMEQLIDWVNQAYKW